tara:strand:- start:1085 stop:1327 length:243 start_codon:yes stop_codon:yes gene_type:complete
MSRPRIQHSNITYYAIQKGKVESPKKPEDLPEPVEIKKYRQNIDRIQVKRLSDTFCPPRLTKRSKPDKLSISPQQGESNE